jgi:hypothetical protein
MKQGKLDQSLKVHNKAIRYCRRALGNDHPLTGDAVGCLACLCMQRELFVEALVAWKEVIGIQLRTVSHCHPTLGVTYANLAACQDKLGDVQGASASRDEARRINVGTELTRAALRESLPASSEHGDGV